jgi:hypothetical protein
VQGEYNAMPIKKQTTRITQVLPPDDLLDVLIGRAVSGKPSPWRTSQNFRWKGSFEATYREGGDNKQILLWAIEDCAQKGTPVPKWAAEALHGIMFRDVAIGRIKTWEDAFGPIRTDQLRQIQTRQHMVAVWRKVRELNRTGCKDWEKLYEDVAKEFNIGIGKVSEYYRTMQKFMKRHGPDVCMEFREKSVRD